MTPPCRLCEGTGRRLERTNGGVASSSRFVPCFACQDPAPAAGALAAMTCPWVYA